MLGSMDQERRGRKPNPEQAVKEPRINIRVSPELRRRVHIAAAQAEVPVGTWAQVALEEKLERDGKGRLA
jgi:predicted HicB family RNase H-like nuclease